MSSQNTEKPRGLPNPYTTKGLPNPYAAKLVYEGAPVKNEQAKPDQKKTPASGFHNPHNIKRPQAKGNAVKKPTIARPAMASSSSDPASSSAPSQQPGLEWWRSTVDEDAETLDQKREWNRAQKEKKKQEKKFVKQYGWWKGEAPYKADRPSNLRAYRASGSYRYKLDSFTEFLQGQAGPPQSRKNSSDFSDKSGSVPSAGDQSPPFVPKSSFAPPASYDPAPHSVATSQDQSGEDAYAQRARISSGAPSSSFQQNVPPPPPGAPNAAPPPPPPPSAPYNPTISAPPVRYNPTVSAPPVRYNPTVSAPPVRHDEQVNDDSSRPLQDERPAKRQKMSKAEAMMAKMGHVKGQGLGKNSDGILTHLEVKLRKNERRVDTRDEPSDDKIQNVKSQQVFDILGGQVTKKQETVSKFGQESRVVVAWGCVDDVDWAADADRDDGGIRQEMGQTFDTKFGRIERVHVNLASQSQPVYIKFASDLSALNAVNRFDEGYEFRGRKIRAEYYNEAKFEASVFEH